MTHLTHSTKSVGVHDIERAWHVIDLKNTVLGRAVPRIALLLQGKHKTQYVPYLDTGDNVVVINARHVKLTGKKAATKTYGSYSGYPGGLKEESFSTLREKNPQKIVHHAVSGMLPKNKLRDRRLARLHIFPEAEHTFGDKVASSK